MSDQPYDPANRRAKRAKEYPEPHIETVKAAITGDACSFPHKVGDHSDHLILPDRLGPALCISVHEKTAVRQDADQTVQHAAAVRAHEKEDLTRLWLAVLL